MHVRVDFFTVNDKLYFSELTFASGAGFYPITHEEFDLEMGSWLGFPKKGQ